MRVLSLFSGIGAFDLGLQRAGMAIAGQCEIDPFCLAVLQKHWPHVERFTDVTKLTEKLVRERCGPVDLICGGFPCQDISTAGKGAGIHGARSGLWGHMLRIIGEVGPAWVVIENVPALRSRGADTVLAGMEAAGYTPRPVVVGAWAVGAPHKRDRVWIVANRCGGAGDSGAERTGRSEGADVDRGGAGATVDVANSNGRGGCPDEHGQLWPSGPGQSQHAWEAPRLVKFPLGGAVDGTSVRLVRFANRNALKALGNALIPQIPELIGRWIMSQSVAHPSRPQTAALAPGEG